MLAMTSVTVNYTFQNVFLTFYISHAGSPKRRGVRGNLPPTLLLDGPGCVNNALINALKINASTALITNADDASHMFHKRLKLIVT